MKQSKKKLNTKELTPEWQKYYNDLSDFDKYMAEKKPQRESFTTEQDYNKAMSEWTMADSCDAPNKPGYFRANND